MANSPIPKVRRSKNCRDGSNNWKRWCRRYLMKRSLQNASLLFAFCGICAAAETSYWIEPCTNAATGCVAADTDLARWALSAWQTASGGKLQFVETKDKAHALLRIVWADQTDGLYGEAVPIMVEGRRGAQLNVRIADGGTNADGKRDVLLRDTIVYLTCLHESGHALGLPHTAAFADIMYSFQYGGDIPDYFGRYRRKLNARADIERNGGMSPEDQKRLVATLAQGDF